MYRIEIIHRSFVPYLMLGHPRLCWNTIVILISLVASAGTSLNGHRLRYNLKGKEKQMKEVGAKKEREKPSLYCIYRIGHPNKERKRKNFLSLTRKAEEEAKMKQRWFRGEKRLSISLSNFRPLPNCVFVLRLLCITSKSELSQQI